MKKRNQDDKEPITVEQFMIFDQSVSPEERLWLAVIEMTFWDAKECAKKLRASYTAGTRVRDDIMRDASSAWFGEICQFVNIDHSFVLAQLNRIMATEN